MTISSNNRKAGPYTGNGVTTQFAFSFKVFQASDLYVARLNTSTLVEDILALTTDYTVTLNANQNSSPGGTVTMVAAPSSTQKITITSNISNLQPTDLTNQGGFYPTVINDALDRATIQIQQVADDVSRSLTIPFSTYGVGTQIPYPVGGTLLGWNAGGTSIANYSISDVLTVAGSSGFTTQTFSGNGSTTAFTLSAQPGAIANLEVFIAGVRQRPSIDYTLSTATLTFTSAPGIGTSNILARWGTTLGIGVPSDTSVTPAKLSTGGPSWDVAGNVSLGGTVVSRFTSNGDIALGAVTQNKFYYYYASGTNYAYTATGAAGDIVWFSGTTSPAERMRLLADSGSLCVGGNSVLATGSHSLYGSGSAPLTLRNTGSTAGRYWFSGPDSNASYIVYNNAGVGMYMGYNATSWTANSDERLKTDLKPIENAAAKVSSLRTVTGRYKTDEEGTSRSFLIAQDVQAVLPEAVSVQNDEQGTLGVAYTDLIPLLTAAIKEQQATIENLTARIAALEART